MNNDKPRYTDFDEYIRQGEPCQKEKASIWQTAIGLQAVDGLQTSEYLRATALKHIEGEVDIDGARKLIDSYYQSKTQCEPDDDEKQEADKVSANITKILSSQTIDFTTDGYISTHRRVFDGVFKHAGKLREYDITKREWVLNGDTVNYLNWEDIRRAIDYDISQEKNFSYKGISPDVLAKHITQFVSGLWQIHAFCEGNTRTTAVFTILYLRSIGFKVDNTPFARHSWYFRNALVRANYKNALKGIDYTPVYLERFFRNLLLGEQWDLRNRYLHIQAIGEWETQHTIAFPAESTPTEDKRRTSTGQAQDKLQDKPQDKLQDKLLTDNAKIMRLIAVIAHQKLSVKDMMEAMKLKGRDNFLNRYLNPAISEGYVCLLYPNSPRHPYQKYLLTAKGIALHDGM